MYRNARRDPKDCLKDFAACFTYSSYSNSKRIIQLRQILSRHRWRTETRVYLRVVFIIFSKLPRCFPLDKGSLFPRALRTINDRFALLLPVYPVTLLPIKINRDCYLLNNPNATRVFAELPAISATIFETPPNSTQPFSKLSRLKTRKEGRKEGRKISTDKFKPGENI